MVHITLIKVKFLLKGMWFENQLLALVRSENGKDFFVITIQGKNFDMRFCMKIVYMYMKSSK